MAIPFPVGALIALLLTSGALVQAWRLGLIGMRHRVAWFRCDQEGRWQLSVQDTLLDAQLCADSRVWSNVLWLGWKTERGRAWTLVLRSAISPDLWRRLQARVRLSDCGA